MRLTSDWHIHSHNSYDEAALLLPDLVAGAARLGITDFGVTDHVNTPYNLPDLAASRRDFLAVKPSPRFHFGVEVSVISEWELGEMAAGRGSKDVTWGIRGGGRPGCAMALGITAEDVRRHGVEFVLGAVHWPLYVPRELGAIIRDYHRQNLFLAAHPLVTIVAHPWLMGHWQSEDGVYRADFGVIPRSMHEEFAAAAIEHGKVVEISMGMLLSKSFPEKFRHDYADYLAWLKGRGVRLSFGSDCHGRYYDMDFGPAAAMLEAVGIRDEDLWRLPPRAGAGV